MGDLGTAEGRKLQDRLTKVERRLACFSDSKPVMDDCLDLLARARAALSARLFAECEDLVLRAECRLERAAMSLTTVGKWWIWIVLYAVAFVYVVLVVASKGELLPGKAAITIDRPGWLPPAPYFVWSAVGGAAACLFGLFLHASLRDFDEAYIPWYFIKPAIGLLFGPLIYYLARAGLMATTDSVDIKQPSLLYLGAFVIAFGERLSIRLVDRVSTAIFGPPEAPGAPAPSPAPSGAAELSAAPAGPVTPPTGGAPSGGSIRVTVKGPDPEGMADVSATLRRGEDVVEVKGPPPDEQDAFVFGGLPAGGYRVDVSKEGWQQVAEASAEIRRPDDVVEVETNLKPSQE